MLEVQTPEGIRLRTELAGVGSRMAAALLDLILIVAGYLTLLLSLVAAYALSQEAGIEVAESLTGFVVGIASGGLLLLVPLYFIGFHTLWNGQTPGKRMLRLRVVDEHGSGAGMVAHLLRGLLWLVDALLFLPMPIGLMLISLTPRCRRLGDMAAGTLVLCEPSAATFAEPWPDQTWSAIEEKKLDLSAGMAAKLGEEDLGLMRDAICRRDIPREERHRIYVRLVKHYANVLGFTAHENPRVSLKELYLFGRERRQEQ